MEPLGPLLRLDGFPVGQDLAGPLDPDVPEDMGMPPDELVHEPGDHVLDGERPGLARHLRVEHHLEQQVSQFLAEVVG